MLNATTNLKVREIVKFGKIYFIVGLRKFADNFMGIIFLVVFHC